MPSLKTSPVQREDDVTSYFFAFIFHFIREKAHWSELFNGFR